MGCSICLAAPAVARSAGNTRHVGMEWNQSSPNGHCPKPSLRLFRSWLCVFPLGFIHKKFRGGIECEEGPWPNMEVDLCIILLVKGAP